MTLSPGLTAINCTACGAGLDVLGGGRVRIHICPYCGTELDALHDYRALRKFANADRPETPFRIGMKGHLKGVAFTIIGTLQHREDWKGKTWTWVDHQLYSPTHGYAWLTVEDGHLVFTRRVRTGAWLSSDAVERAEKRPSIRVEGERFLYYETSTSQIVFAQGEFTWRPRVGESSVAVSAMSDSAMLSFEESAQEREIYRSEYLTRQEVEEGFDIETGLAPERTHPLQPFRPGRHHAFLRNTGIAFAALCLALALFMESQPGQTVLPPKEVPLRNLPAAFPFEIADAERLAEIALSADVDNSWASVEMDVTDPDDTALMEAERTVEYYHGVDADGAWSEGSRREKVLFRPSVAGPYLMDLAVTETGLWPETVGTRPALSRLQIEIREGISSGFWLFLLAPGFAVVAGVPLMRAAMHRKARWYRSDWTEED